MINPKEYLAMDDKTFAVEIAKKLTPGPWKHDPEPDASARFICTRCNKNLEDYIYRAVPGAVEFNDLNDCPIPDPIILDPNTAKIWQGKYEASKYYSAMRDIHSEIDCDGSFDVWLLFDAQPRHYLLAAAIVLEGD